MNSFRDLVGGLGCCLASLDGDASCTDTLTELLQTGRYSLQTAELLNDEYLL